MRGERDHFHVGLRAGHAEQFHADLVELALAPFLRTFVAEHGAAIEELEGCLLRQPAADERARDTGGAFGTQGDAFAALGLEGVHLLRHDIGGIAQGAREHLGEFEHRRGDLAVAVARRDFERRRLDEAMTPHVVEHQVMGAANGLER